jgi:hypothetical protein
VFGGRRASKLKCRRVHELVRRPPVRNQRPPTCVRTTNAGPISAEPSAKRPGDGGRAPFTFVLRSALWLLGWLVIEFRIGGWTRKNRWKGLERVDECLTDFIFGNFGVLEMDARTNSRGLFCQHLVVQSHLLLTVIWRRLAPCPNCASEHEWNSRQTSRLEMV